MQPHLACAAIVLLATNIGCHHKPPPVYMGCSPGEPPIDIDLLPDTYGLSVRVLGGMRLDTTVVARQGYRDTVDVRIQRGGLTICS